LFKNCLLESESRDFSVQIFVGIDIFGESEMNVAADAYGIVLGKETRDREEKGKRVA
jgi:hypothetical protein